MTPYDVFADVQVMLDGSYRWLWMVRVKGRLFRAGICMSQGDAQACADREMRALGVTVLPSLGRPAKTDDDEPTIDFDALDASKEEEQ